MKLQIEKLVYGGAGVGEIDGKIFFVPFSAPGDVLDVEIIDDHGSYAEARISKIIEPAPCRVDPLCSVFGKCGGCQWQHISYDAQIEWKRRILIETLKRIGKLIMSQSDRVGATLRHRSGHASVASVGRISPPLPVRDLDELVLPTLASPKQWNYRNRIQLHVDSRGRAGFYRPKSKEVVEFDKCLIADEHLNERLNAMRESLKFRSKGIALRLQEGPAFFQINTEQNENLKKLVCEWLGEVPHDSILELYAGSGNFTFSIAKIAKRIVASDIDGKSIKFAKERQQKEGINNVELFCKPAEKAAAKFDSGCDAVLIDPPRKGCAEAIDAIVNLSPKIIIYISCDPATLSRDIKSFIEHGYALKKSQPVDMFPQTYHIESINLLTR